MRFGMRIVAGLSVVLLTGASAALAGTKDVCVRIDNTHRGKNCGSGDSIQVDVVNNCGVQVRGDVIFAQPSGDPVRLNVILGSSDRRTVWTCHSNGKVAKDFSVEKK